MEVWDCEPGCAVLAYGKQVGDPLAHRFFAISKSTQAERDAGLSQPNQHPSIKSISLMRHLVKLVSKEGDVVLDCFAGSGTTGIAALLDRRNYILVEREESYHGIAEARIAWWRLHGEHGLEHESRRKELEEMGQLTLMDSL